MARDELIEERLTDSIIGAYFEVYNRLGYGFFEAAYTRALMIELADRGHHVAREVAVDLYYKGHNIGRQRVDLIVDEKVIVEIKSTEILPSRLQAMFLIPGSLRPSSRPGPPLRAGAEGEENPQQGSAVGPEHDGGFPDSARPPVTRVNYRGGGWGERVNVPRNSAGVYTRPARITKSMFRRSVIRSCGFPLMISRSATLPGAIVP